MGTERIPSELLDSTHLAVPQGERPQAEHPPALHKGHGVAPLHEGHSVAPRDSWPHRAARPGSVPSGLEAVTAETTSSISTPRPK